MCNVISFLLCANDLRKKKKDEKDTSSTSIICHHLRLEKERETARKEHQIENSKVFNTSDKHQQCY